MIWNGRNAPSELGVRREVEALGRLVDGRGSEDPLRVGLGHAGQVLADRVLGRGEARGRLTSRWGLGRGRRWHGRRSTSAALRTIGIT